MADWVEGGQLVTAILMLTVLEWLALVAYHGVTGRGVRPRDVSANLISGMCLLVGLREALVGGWWGWIAAALSGALVAHLVDLRGRWTPDTRRPR